MTSPESQIDLGNNIPQDIPQPLIEPLHHPPKNRWLRLLLVTILLIGGSVGVAWRLISPQPSSSKASTPAFPAVLVKLSPVHVGNIEDSSEYVATLDSRRSVNLIPRTQGQVTQIFVRSGTKVAFNQEILQIDARQQQAAVNSVYAAGKVTLAQLQNAKANLKSLQAQRLATLADLHMNQKDYMRYSTLVAEGAVAVQMKDQYFDKLATSKSQLASINAQIIAQQATVSQYQKFLLQADANTRQQQVQLQYYKVLAPFSGTVGDIPVKVGDYVTTSTQLASLTQNQPLEVRISVPLERGLQLHKGLGVDLLDEQGNIIGRSQVFFIAPIINNTSQSILAKALYDNSDGELRSSQFIRARVIWNQHQGVLIPTTSISRIAGENFVFVAKTEKSPQGVQLVARQKPITLGEIRGNDYQVLSGLKPDEKIIVSGLLNLRDGLPIKVLN